MQLPKGGSPERFRYEKWAWCVITGAVLLCYFFLPAVWASISILYLALVSNYALVATFAGAEQAAEAKNMADPSIS